MDIDARFAERNAEDRRQAWALIALGVPFALGGWLFLSWAVTLLLWFLSPLGLGASFAVAGGVVAALMAIDTWRNPSEFWHRARYFVPGVGPGDRALIARDGPFAGMPLMAPMDPTNLAEHGRTVSSGCANVVLGGPRNIRRGIEQLRLVRARTAGVPALRSFLKWLHDRGSLAEAELAAAVEEDADRRLGFLLAREIGLLTFSPSADGRRISLR